MKKSIKLMLTVLLVVVVAAGCNFPTIAVQYPSNVVTPNMTLTALFDTSQNIPPTVTPVIVIVTNTPGPVTETPTNTAVPTSTATSTAVPTATATATIVQNLPPQQPQPPQQQVMQRGGTLMSAAYLNFTPTIDGSWSEWKDYTTQYPAASVVYGRNNWTGADDLEASYAAAWDYNYLYLGVKVRDDNYVQNATGANLYLGDSIELLLDTNLYGDYYIQSLNSDDYQLGISAGNAGAGIAPEAYLWFPSNVAGSRSQVTIGSTFETGVYRIEAQIPWSVFGITPTAGMHLGIAVSASDNDNSGSNIQQTMVSSAYNRHLTNPTTWGEIILTK